MDRRIGTKTPGEREDEEVERLVRPSPKVKPPRHDLRRETVEADKDLDLDAKDKDLSKNFKDIGGSVASRVVARWAKGPVSVPSAKKPPGSKAPVSSKPPAAAAAKAPVTGLVKVRSKATGWVGEISQDKLKENPGAYELAKDTDEAKFKGKKTQAPIEGKPEQSQAQPKAPEPKAQPKPEVQPKPEAKPEETEGAAAREESDRAAQAQLHAMAAEDPAFGAKLEDFKKPNSHSAAIARGNPGWPAEKLLQGKDLPAGVKTIGDVARIMNLPPVPKKQPRPEVVPPAVPPAQPAPAQPSGGAAPAQPMPPATGQQPSSPQQPAPAPQPNPVPAIPPPPAQGQPAAPPKFQAPTPEDPKDRALRNDLVAVLKGSPDLAEALKLSKAQLKKDAQTHPDELVSKYYADVLKNGVQFPAGINTIADLQRVIALSPQAKAPVESKKDELSPDTYGDGQPKRPVSSSERAEAIRQVTKTFPWAAAKQILQARPPYHPDEVTALIKDFNVAQAVPSKDLGALIGKASGFYASDPTKVPAPKGLDELPEKERAEALRKHQVQTVAMSLGVKVAVAKSYESNGASKEVSDTIAEFALKGGSAAQRSKRAEKMAAEIFTGGLKRDNEAKPLSEGAVAKILGTSDDPAVKKLIVAHCQAADYQEARSLYLDPSSDNAITERQTPSQIASKLKKAANLLRERAARYPEGTTSQDASVVFRNRVMKHLASLKPDKAAEVQSLLDAEDNKYYDEQLAKHEKAAKVYQKKRAEVEQHYDSDYKAYSAKLKSGGDPDEDPPPNVDDRLAEAAIEEPKPPIKPVNYDKLTKKPEELGAAAQDLWKQFQSRFASNSSLIQRVAARGSIYSPTCAMDRTAVYWGVDPYPKGKEGPEPYQGWQQPQARDLGDSDFTKILKAARSWLKEPVLSANIEGIVRDTQLRAALDLALRAENYERAVHPAVYNKLLARLAGVSEDETLLTVRSKTARNPMSKKVELETARADRLLAGLDRIASVVQTNHKQWGMDFTAAKNLVNAIDKIADELEASTYGEASLLNRQAQEIGREKLAQVIEKNSDEKYMSTFDNPMSPHQTEADEPYMRQYKDDQSSAVRKGKSTSGRALAP